MTDLSKIESKCTCNAGINGRCPECSLDSKATKALNQGVNKVAFDDFMKDLAEGYHDDRPIKNRIKVGRTG